MGVGGGRFSVFLCVFQVLKNKEKIKCSTGFFVLTLNLRIVKTRWRTLSGLTQPSVVKLLHRTPPPTWSPASLQPPPAFLLSHKRSLVLSQGLCNPCRPAWNILPHHSTCLAVLGEAAKITI